MTSATARLLTVNEALAAGTPLLVLKAHALEAIRSLVPASLLLFATLTRRFMLRDVVALQTEPLARELTDIWDRYVLDAARSDPFVTAPLPAGAVAVLDELAAGDEYMSFLTDCGIGDFAAMYLRVSGTVAAVVGLARSTDRRAFSRRDATDLLRLQPLIEHPYEAAVAPRAPATSEVLRASGLSAREIEVAELIARGASNAQVGRRLHISEATVKTHLSHIYTKLGVTTRTQLAIRSGAS